MAKKTTNAPSQRAKLKRTYERGHYDEKTIHSILDVMPLCHVSYILDGAPVVTPTIQWRDGNHIYWHGSSASRLIRKSTNADVCIAVTILDGMVMARSAFHHSANFRSVMLFGKAKVVDEDHAEQALKAMVEGLYPGRWDILRAITEKEMKATTVLSMPINEASAKIRTGPPVDDDEDYELAIWAGIIPVSQSVGKPQNDPKNLEGLAAPDHVTGFKIG